MLHLRVVCAADNTETVTAQLLTEPGVAHLVIARVVSTQPSGDVIEAEVALRVQPNVAVRPQRPVLLITAGLTLLARVTNLFDPAELSQLHAVSFIYQVGPYSVIIALLAGVAGMLSLTSEKSGVLIGVFISVTTVPAAGFTAVAAVAGHWSQCGSALLQLLINLIGITLAGVLTLLVRQRFVFPRPARTHHA